MLVPDACLYSVVVARKQAVCLLTLANGVGLSTQVGSSRTGLVEVSTEHGLHEGLEDNIGAAKRREREPQEEQKLEGVIEWEPVDDVDKALNDGEESKNNPVGKPLGIVCLVGGEQGLHRIVARKNEASKVGQKLPAKIKDDEEEVESGHANDSIDLGD